MTAVFKKLRALLESWGEAQLAALVEAFCAGDEEVLSLISVKATACRVHAAMNNLPTLHFFAMKAALFFFEHLPPWQRPFSRRTLDERVRAVSMALVSSWRPKRLPVVGLRFLCVSHIYSEPTLLRSIGYGSALARRQGL